MTGFLPIEYGDIIFLQNSPFFLYKFSGLPCGALIFVFYCFVEIFAFRVTARLEDPKPVTSQHPCCRFEYFFGVFY